MTGIVSLEQNGKKNVGIVLRSTIIPGQGKLHPSETSSGPETAAECLFQIGIPCPDPGTVWTFQTGKQIRNAVVIQAEITGSNRDFIRMVLRLN